MEIFLFGVITIAIKYYYNIDMPYGISMYIVFFYLDITPYINFGLDAFSPV